MARIGRGIKAFGRLIWRIVTFPFRLLWRCVCAVGRVSDLSSEPS
jgi:hypothetical protein